MLPPWSVPAVLLKMEALQASISSGHLASLASLHSFQCPCRMDHTQTLRGCYSPQTCTSRDLLMSAGQNPKLTVSHLSAPARMASSSFHGLTVHRASSNIIQLHDLGKCLTTMSQAFPQLGWRITPLGCV